MSFSPFPWPGGKAAHVEWILDHVPEHTTWCEPFGGSAAVLFNKPRSHIEVYNDLDGDIVQFFDVARERPDDLKEWCRRTPFSEELFNRWAPAYYRGERPDDDVERAGIWLFLRFTQHSGKADHVAGFKRDYPRKKRGSSFRWQNVDAKIDAIADRMQGVSIQSGDFAEMIARYDTPETVFYCDPPYLGSENSYRVRDFEHGDLAAALRGIEGYALVSYTDRPDGYVGWLEETRESHHEGHQDAKQVTERLLMNFDPERHPRFVDDSQRTLAEVGSQ
ncbi:DNA adenine methylase [Halomarina oriensis]|uniref:site-specific DNA-methyltransferase (adenine-specific) n=1 Tax=Halomarina oriensis TaxID=671145 RepID=A0A6B0GWQ4_9EURY|nr:DNA adenine methylase [Halomarina oriensis]